MSPIIWKAISAAWAYSLRDNAWCRAGIILSPATTPPWYWRTLILEAHQDTVPVDNMTIAPFGAVIEGNRLYGRGACDIKGGMAAMLAAFGRLVRAKPGKSANVIMACTVDEEFTFLGVQHLVKDGIQGDMAVVAEPTALNIVHAHKGVARWILTVPGRSCHSSSPEQGVSAIYRMGRLVTGIESYAEKLCATQYRSTIGSGDVERGTDRGGYERQHRAGSLSHRDRSPARARRNRGGRDGTIAKLPEE